ncbi:MAG: class I SAM-dependent methyltransferase [Alphaproteobacteria bacterium]|nr:class I SAM-dependent methyltransferase [Alphaproteobacteria bacterium]
MSSTRSIFSSIYRGNLWGDPQSASGPGSTLRQTEILSRELPKLLAELGIRTLVDAPCGDMNWMRRLDYAFERFYGIDVAPEVIAKLKGEIWSERYEFICADIARDPLPAADAILCRDALVHLPYQLIEDFLANLRRSEIPYLLTTHFPEKVNKDTAIGGWRALNFEDEPFGWPAPLRLIRERAENPADPYNDKSLALWRVSGISVRR